MTLQYRCKDCGSLDIVRDAFADWDVEEQEWVLSSVYDYMCCRDCGEESIEEVVVGD